jgi:hypothetical protein
MGLEEWAFASGIKRGKLRHTSSCAWHLFYIIKGHVWSDVINVSGHL